MFILGLMIGIIGTILLELLFASFINGGDDK